jgi:hypothetical protein
MLSMPLTISMTWDFSARPYPVTAFFTSRALYSKMGMPDRDAVRRTTPLVCPKFRAAFTPFAKNIRSMQTSPGKHLSITSARFR